MADEQNNPLAKQGPGRPKVVKDEKEPKTKVEVKPLEIEDANPIGDEEEVTLTGKEMKALKSFLSKSATSVVEKSDEGIVGALIQALRESQKPYKSEADKENDKRQNEQMRASVKRQRRNQELERAACQHLAGCNQLSDRPADTTSIIWHEVHSHLWLGICTVCQREFWPTDADYAFWRRKRSFNTQSRAGEHNTEMNNDEYVAAEHPRPFGSETGLKPMIPASQASPLWQ
jgi:hypothetical protein